MSPSRLSVLMPALEETDDSLSDECISAMLSRHVDASLCIHWSMVFFYCYICIKYIEMILTMS